MLYLEYTFKPTEHAHAHQAEFWRWMSEREPWFYADFRMVRGTSWRMESSGTRPLIHHLVEFDDTNSIAEYRAAVAAKAKEDPLWEKKRMEQDLWYEIIGRSVQTSSLADLGFQR
ncbi:hypothetical protein QF035_009133 [Streptomyces umbrinus]|uniref:NIPSNAP domain-containing protein n=1 Tax=Streptomyces umbrinus TaxID=67370 RepID=A0ABU0T6Z9_9ACTN|nr:hypothetical protein [Streptomyces umbrinus]MDQ1031551.1 hypothetical protein [Streptomyces umbrinus]